MSYDVAVFDPRAELRNRDTFMEWYEARTEWEDGLNYQDPKNATSNLQAWYREMISIFPPMNGPDAPSMDDTDRWEWKADYSIANDIIYVGFGWSKAEKAYEAMHRLAAKHSVGFFDASGNTGAAWFPEAGASLAIAHEEGSGIDA